MRVLVLHSELGVLQGGGENFTRNLFAAFVRRGHEVTAAFVADRAGRYPLPLPAGIVPLPLPGYWNRTFGQAFFGRAATWISARWRQPRVWVRLQEAVNWRVIRWHNRRFQRRVERACATRWSEFDVVYVHGDPELASQAARHRPTVLRLPGPVGPECAPFLHAVDVVCANGDALSRVREFLHDRVLELPPGIDRCAFRPGATNARTRLGWTADDVVFGFVGRMTRLKGVDLLAEAFHELATSGSAVRLLMIGTGDERDVVVSRLGAEIARRAAVVEPGVDHAMLAEWYRAMDVLVMPSRYENYSNSILEAMACGVPFIASDTGGNCLLARSGAGWLFEAGSAAALLRCLREVAGNRAEIAVRARAAVEDTRTRSTWAHSAQRLEDIIRSRAGLTS